jgi:N-acetyl-D-muramate 6-phosphate phosphatase
MSKSGSTSAPEENTNTLMSNRTDDRMIKALLFDLDGTFADTAPDLSLAMNLMREKRGMPTLPVALSRPVTSTGARGLLSVGFSITPEHADYPAMRQEFLDLYASNLWRHTTVFPGMPELLAAAAARGLKWGIVTNKAERFAKPLIAHLDTDNTCACVIGGDTAPRMKPHPDPLLAACSVIGIAPQHCLYVGDDRRDIDAGRAAGMKTIAVRYGYLNGGVPETWGADAVVDCPQDIIGFLDAQETLSA